jgi:hypothetical protein
VSGRFMRTTLGVMPRPWNRYRLTPVGEPADPLAFVGLGSVRPRCDFVSKTNLRRGRLEHTCRRGSWPKTGCLGLRGERTSIPTLSMSALGG